MAGLAEIEHADLSKIVTFEQDASQLTAADIPRVTHLSFIDGEHMNMAVVSDFHACLTRTAPVSIIGFHDCFLVSGGILECSRELRDSGLRFTGFHLEGSAVFAYAIGEDPRLVQCFTRPQ